MTMLFANRTLAARIDRAEHENARAFAELAAVRRSDALIRPIGTTAALYSGPDEPWNKLVGLGFGPLDEEVLAEIEREFDEREAAIRVEISTLADGAVTAALTRRGYELIGFENVLGLALAGGFPDEGSDPAITISRAADHERGLWIDTVLEAFAQPDVFDGPPPTEAFPTDALRRVFEDVVAAASTVLYLARRNGEIAGGGSIRVIDGLAMLNGAATLPAHRRRGVQSALLRARLADAAESRCDLAVVTTEPASKSQENVQKLGFDLLYPRAILVRPVAKAPDGASATRSS
jgi:ribosomal protein S18 acetylase RimI-like enzyme